MTELFLNASVFMVIFCLRLIVIISGAKMTQKESGTAKTGRVIIVASCYLAVYLVTHRIIKGNWNIFRTAKNILAGNYTCQSMLYVPVSLLVCFCITIGFALAVRGFTGARANRKIAVPLMITGTLQILVSFVILMISVSGQRSITISEICAYDEIAYDHGDYGVYVELYNPGPFNCDLDGMFLSDSDSSFDRLRIQNGILGAGRFTVISVYGEEINISRKEGSFVYLYDEEGSLIDEAATLDTKYGECSGLVDGSEWTLVSATPGAENVRAINDTDESIPVPEFSYSAGFYDEPFDLEITGQADCDIYYTTDCSTPDEDSLRYTGPIHVFDRTAEPNVFMAEKRCIQDYDSFEEPSNADKAFVVRAVAIDKNSRKSRVVSATYLVDKDRYRNAAVLSIVADPDELIGDDGIYVTGKEYDDWYEGSQEGEAPEPNFTKAGRGYEIPSWIDVISDDVMLSQNAGLRVTGESTRKGAIKPLALYARKEYGGSDHFEADLFEGIRTGRIRTKGNYCNPIAQILGSGRDVMTTRAKKVALFVNGEFVSSTALIAKYDPEYIEQVYGVDRNNVVIFKSYRLAHGNASEEGLYEQFIRDAGSTDFTDEERYDELLKEMDMQSYLDSLCLRTYMGDLDFTDVKNVCIWKSRLNDGSEYGDCRWRWGLRDLDGIIFEGLDPAADSYHIENDYRGGRTISTFEMYEALKANERFRRSYVTTFMDLTNSVFKYDNVKRTIEEYGPNLTDYLGEDSRTIDDYLEFFRKRPEYIVKFMADEMKLKGTLQKLEISVNDDKMGDVSVNTIEAIEFESSKWEGDYFTDYPVRLSAVPREGYRFTGWKGDIESADSEIEIDLSDGGASVYAVFEKK